MYCKTCEKEYESNFRFCERCGQKLIEQEIVEMVNRLPMNFLSHPTKKKPNFKQFNKDAEDMDLDEEKEGSLASFFSHKPIPKTKIYSRRM